ncbi:hypothetical protein ACIQPT_07000 [Streptomyces sp. NPDC091289]|uniref:hypothetical protein n=1 Tax=Streptomyces sp. NPDC091289 TaxID=3365989 RepID=UPI003830D228
MNKQARSGAAASAQQIATEARTALLRGDIAGASVLADVAHVYALIAAGQPNGAERTDPAPVVVHVPAPPVPVDFPAPQLALHLDTGAASDERFDGSASEAPADESGEVSVLRDPNTGVPTLLVRAHEAIVRAGGKMYSADLAAHLGIDTQKLGTVLTKHLREVGISRPGNGMVSIARGKPFRTGFIADTLATGIAVYRVRATSAAA